MTVTSGAVVDVTEGREVPSGQTLALRHRYLAAEDALASFTVISPTAVVSYEGGYALSPSYGDPDYFAIARALRDLASPGCRRTRRPPGPGERARTGASRTPGWSGQLRLRQ